MTPLSALTPFVDVLPPTAAGKARALLWYADLAGRGWCCDHVAVVQQQGHPEPDYYAVHEFSAASGRAFYAWKRGEAEPYAVYCSDRGEAFDSCSCAGGCYRRAGVQACRHLLALRAALSNGWVAPAADDVPGDDGDGYTDDELAAMAAEYAEEELARMA